MGFRNKCALTSIYKYLDPMEIIYLRLLNREINMVVRQTLNTVNTRSSALTIDVIKLISMFPNLAQVVYRHFLTNTDIKNNFRMYTNTLVKFELHGRHFAWQKAFSTISLPKLKHFALTDSSQSFIKDDIKEFGRACPHVTHLNLSGVSNLENSQLEDILSKLLEIKYLSLLRNNKLTNEFFTTLTNKVRDLEGLEMGGKPN